MSSIALLGIPIDGQDATVEGLKADIANARGKMALIEMGDWGNSGDAKVALKSERFGSDPPASLVELVDVSSRESIRGLWLQRRTVGRLELSSSSGSMAISPIRRPSSPRRLVEAELQDKLEDTVTLSWVELRASDLSGRARAMQSMVNGGMSVTDAVAVAGLMVED